MLFSVQVQASGPVMFHWPTQAAEVNPEFLTLESRSPIVRKAIFTCGK
jgi:hypothetical protein